MSSPTIFDYLPDVYRGFLGDFFRAPLPQEHLSDCARCPMAVRRNGEVRARFEPSLKCCTYYPRLPNYLLGAILADEGNDGPVRQRLRRALEVDRTLTPAFFGPTAAFTASFESSRLGFGRDPDLRCPFLGAGGCKIWQHRNHQCTTFFCLHRVEAPGRAFWRALRSYLSYTQNTLAKHCCTTLAVPIHGSAFDGTDEFARRVESGVNPVARIFGPFADDPLSFLERCYAVTSTMRPADWRALTGPVHDRLLTKLQKAHMVYGVALDSE